MSERGRLFHSPFSYSNCVSVVASWQVSTSDHNCSQWTGNTWEEEQDTSGSPSWISRAWSVCDASRMLAATSTGAASTFEQHNSWLCSAALGPPGCGWEPQGKSRGEGINSGCFKILDQAKLFLYSYSFFNKWMWALCCCDFPSEERHC